MTHPGVLFMRLIAPLPLVWVRGLGTVVGWVLYALAVPRRRVVMANLALCFPQQPLAVRKRWARDIATFEKIGAWAITEPNSGSDAFGSMASTARRDGLLVVVK